MKVVLDTNVVVSALVFDRGHLSWLRSAWISGRVAPLIDRPCLDELLRVLAYPKFVLDEDEIRALLGDYLPYAQTVDTRKAGVRGLPRCKDPADRKFLALSRAGKAEALITGDTALLELADDVPFAILSPADLRKRIDPRASS